MPTRRPAGPKQIHRNSIIADRGIALIHTRVSKMGFVWTPSGTLEAGIDGQIEIRDNESGEMFNAIVRVQSKATLEPLGQSAASSFEYICDQRDIDYWMKGNAPVIIVRSNPDRDEAYWKSIKDYFSDQKRRAARRVVFDRSTDCFDVSAKAAISRLAVPADQGVYFAPVPKHERLLSNLLEVVAFGPTLYLASTAIGTTKELYDTARAKNIRLDGDCLVRDKRLLSFHDLREEPWRQFCDVGSVEPFPTSEWSESEDEQKKRDFVELLGRCVTERLRKFPVRRDKERRIYYFLPGRKNAMRPFTYRSLKRKAQQTVFQAYMAKGDPKRVAYYRHTALETAFHRYGKKWYLELVPTYHFTTDGSTPHPTYEPKLKGKKAQERNNAVRNLVLMWASLFYGSTGELLPDANAIQFGSSLLSFDIEAGLTDAEWAPTDESSVEPEDTENLELFDEN